jgi:hypothetical protein
MNGTTIQRALLIGVALLAVVSSVLVVRATGIQGPRAALAGASAPRSGPAPACEWIDVYVDPAGTVESSLLCWDGDGYLGVPGPGWLR